MNNKSFIRGALLGALTVLLVISTASCGRTAVGRIMGSFST